MQMKTVVIPGLMISLAGSIIFLLTTPPLSFVLFLLFFLLATTITITLSGKMLTLKISIRRSRIGLYVFLILANITLLILQLANIYVEAINATLYVIAFVFTLGFSLLSILGFEPTYSRIEFIALACPLSLAWLAIFGTIALIVPTIFRGIMSSVMIILLSIASLLFKRMEGQTEGQKHHELILNNDALMLIITLLTFTFFFIILYPQIASLLGLDIARNFLNALASTKDSLGNFSSLNSSYPLFSIYQSSIIYVVKPSVEIFQLTTIFLNISTILSFYAMASQYLKRYGDHTPIIATLIWSMFAGFGWLNFFTQKMDNPNASFLSLIGQTNAFSYGDIAWRRLFFYLAMEASLTLVFAVLYFLKRKELSETKLILLMTVLITPLPLMHPYGTYLLLLALICFAIVCSRELRQQLRWTGYSLIIASFASLLLNYLLEMKAPGISISIVTLSEYLLIGSAITVMTFIDINALKLNAIVEKARARFLGTRLILIIITFLLLLYFASILLWFSGSLTFGFANLNLFGYVPWFLYPVKLGILGILGIIAIYVLFTSSEYRSKELIAFLALALLMIFVSRLTSTMQMQYASEFTFNPNSWLSEMIRQTILNFREERMFELFKIPLAILASIVLGEGILIRMKLKKANLSQAIAGSISLILISGMASTFLGFEYYHDLTQTNPLSSSELNIINTMQNRIYANDRAVVISPQTPTPYLDFTGATSIVTESTAAWESKSPELPLFVTRYSEATPTYIYLEKTLDYQRLSDYSGNYLEHVSSMASAYLENQEVQIKAINNWSMPTPKSFTALVIPYDKSTMAVSEPFYQETQRQYSVLALFFEDAMQFLNLYQEPISYNNVEINGTATFSGADSYIRINGTGTDFNRISAEFEFQPLDLTKNQVLLSKFDWGTTPRQMSWDVAQFGRRVVFKISPDGVEEVMLQTEEILALNRWYTIRCEYDSAFMKIFINDRIVASRPYQKGIFQSNIDLMIGAELHNGTPTAFAKMILRYVRVLDGIPTITEPVFYAYDILSSARFNYTTALSSDNTKNNYETQVLPYDDITTYEMLNELEAKQQTINTRYVVILNTNGYGPLLNIFGSMTSESFTADGIFTDNYSALQPSIEVPLMALNDKTEMKAQYVNNALSSPLVMITTRNQFTLIYINIYPSIKQSQLLNPTSIQVLTETLNDYIAMYDETTITPWFTEPSLLFTKLQANGTISTRSNSIASIGLPEGQTLNVDDCRTISIESTEIAVQSGFGFYSTLTAYNPSITVEGNQTTSMEITGYVTFLMRQSKISVNGTIRFEDFYMLHPSLVFTDGRTTTLTGNITLNFYVSDEHTIALPYKLDSPITVRYEKPLMEFDENASFMLMVPYIALIMIFAATILLIQHSRLTSTQEIKNESNQKDSSKE